MRGIYYQLKNIRRDKMCILSFLLPVIIGLAINLLSDVDFSTFGETTFGVVENDLTKDMIEWLEQNGSVYLYNDVEDLHKAIIDPATQIIGVAQDGGSIKAVLSGDEFQVYKTIGNSLPQLFEERKAMNSITVEFHSDHESSLWFKSLLVSTTMVTAMFMGCTFNAMSMIGEKEDGISYINEILPITQQQYIFQKITIGLVGSIVSSVATAIVCMRIETREFLPLLLLIVLSAFISALIGMYIGRFSSGLMVGIVYIKVIMIFFIAPPILFYLMVPVGSIGRILSYLLPSSAILYGLMEMMSGQGQNLITYLAVLLMHSVVWVMVYMFIVDRSLKHDRILQKS